MPSIMSSTERHCNESVRKKAKKARTSSAARYSFPRQRERERETCEAIPYRDEKMHSKKCICIFFVPPSLVVKKMQGWKKCTCNA